LRATIIFKCCLLLVALPFVCSDLASAQTRRRGKTQRPAAQTQTSPQANAEFDQFVKRGDEARLAQRLDEAITLYGRALKIKPTWPDGWWYIGAILYEKDLYPQARDAFQNLQALEPERGAGWAMLGLCQFQTAEYERAVISLQTARSKGITGTSELASVARYHAAILYIRFEQFEVAFDILTEFMRFGHYSPKVVEAFGLALMRMPFLPKEVPADKREQILIAGQAAYNMAARQLDQARTAFDMLLERYSKEPNVHYAFGVYLLNQDADAALKEFKRELEISPNHFPSMVQMAFEYLKRDQYNDALPLAEKAVQLAPKMYPARNVLGRVLLELGQVDRSIKELEEGARLAPSSPEMRFALARAYAKAGRKEDANREREAFKKLQEQQSKQRDAQLINPSNPTPDKPNP
jgi:tetratricopeptide (TPR) repeat protein